MPKRNLVLILAIIAAAILMVWVSRDPEMSRTKPEGDRMRGVLAAMHQIQENYYPISPAGKTAASAATAPAMPDEQKLFQAMVEGMVDSLHDPYSRYIAPDKAGDLDSRVKGRYHGTGLKLDIVEGEVKVIGALIHSPSQKAGLIRGDRIKSIDGQAVAGLALAEVYRLLDAGNEEVVLNLDRVNGVQQELTLRREEFAVETVEGLCRDAAGQWVYLIDPTQRIAYIRIREFTPETIENLQAVLRGLLPLSGLALDLRDNPGGEFPAALSVADLFLKKGAIVTLRRRNRLSEPHLAQEGGTCGDFPLVVLVNGNSASGAEMVAGALAINDRAVLVGSRTMGKGCMQQIVKLGEGLGQMSITVAEYFVGEDQPISRRPGCDTWGVDPHVSLPISQGDEQKLARRRLELELALPRPSTAPAETHPTTLPSSSKIIAEDEQLVRALELLDEPERMTEILAAAAKARQAAKKAATQQATRPAALR